MAMGAKDSEMIKLKYFLKGLGLYKVTKGVHCKEWLALGCSGFRLCRRATSALGRSGTTSKKGRKQSVSFRKPLGEA